MNAREFFRELYRRNPVLALTGWAHVALFALFLLAAPFDARTVTGLNPWIKPMKFALSITIFVWTMAWFLHYVRGRKGAVRVISWGVSLVFLVEMACIVTQAGRGTASHFNVKTPFDAAVFSTMGVMIVINTLLVFASLLLFFFPRTEPLAPAYLWGIRLGLFLFILASLEGFVMVSHMAHTVGAADGGPGLPFVNWSTRAGDLRIAHFLGFHALQLLPLAGHAIAGAPSATARKHQTAFVLALAAAYGALFTLIFLQALHGRPPIALGG